MSMTKHIHVTDLREVTALKIVCRKCGTGHIIPADTRAMPPVCAGCNTRENLGPVVKLLQAIDVLNSLDLPYTIEIETEEAAGSN